MVVKIDEKEMREKREKKGWAGWTPVSEDEERKFKELYLCFDGSRSWCDDDTVTGLEALQARVEGAAVEIKATTLASRNKNKFMVPEEIREMASLAAKCRDPARRKVLRKKAQKARGEFDARMGALPRGKVVKKPVVMKLWVNGRATEDREEWCEDAKNVTMINQRRRKNKLRESEYRGAEVAVAIQGRRVQITVDRVLRARGKMLRGKSNGPAGCLVVEMLSRLPTEMIYKVTHWFQKRFQGNSRAPEAWRILRLVFLKKPDARLEKGLHGFRAIALLSVFSKRRSRSSG